MYDLETTFHDLIMTCGQSPSCPGKFKHVQLCRGALTLLDHVSANFMTSLRPHYDLIMTKHDLIATKHDLIKTAIRFKKCPNMSYFSISRKWLPRVVLGVKPT